MQDIKLGNKVLKNVAAIKVLLVEGGESLYVDSSDTTATSADIVNGKTVYLNGVKVTGTMSIYNGEVE